MQKVATALLQFFLPSSAGAKDCRRALVNTATSYAIVFASLVLLYLPPLVRMKSLLLADVISSFGKNLSGVQSGQLLLYGALLALLSFAEGLFDEEQQRPMTGHCLIVAKVVFWATAVYGVGLFLCGVRVEPLTLLGLAGLSAGQFVIIGMIYRSSIVAVRDARKNVLIVGSPVSARNIAKQLRATANRWNIKGCVVRSESDDPNVLGTIEDLALIARADFVDQVIVSSGADSELAKRAVVEAIRNHVDVAVVPELFVDPREKLSVETVGGLPLITVHEERIPRLGLLVKRCLDVACSLAGLTLLAPVFLGVALAIKFESEGPAFYSATRVGKKGRYFRCYKFRTMYADADWRKEALRPQNQRAGPTFKILDDPRITPLGRVLRRYSIDELPQLWNVFTGTMSIVGPRPHPLDDYRRYRLTDLRRLDVSPGLTGLWQITARRDPSFNTNMALDLEYIEEWSLGLDLKIMLKTFSAVFAGTGA